MHYIIEAKSDGEATAMEKALALEPGDTVYEFVEEAMTLYVAMKDTAGGMHLQGILRVTSNDAVLTVEQCQPDMVAKVQGTGADANAHAFARQLLDIMNRTARKVEGRD